MIAAPCGAADCPVPEPTEPVLRKLRVQTVDPDDTIWWRGTRPGRDPEVLVAGLGDGRFSPLADTSHLYVGATKTVALLESVLHEAAGADATIYIAQLQQAVLTPLRLTAPLRLADLRDPELERLGLPRSAIVNTTARHYRCTRSWASAIQHRGLNGSPADGLIWHSRQADLHATAHGEGLAGELLAHRQVEVAVIWCPHSPPSPARSAGEPVSLVDDSGQPVRLVEELSALIRAPIE